jgi:hypothetical protein
MDTAQILTDLRAERDLIDQAIAALEALNGTALSRTSKPIGARSVRTTVPDGREACHQSRKPQAYGGGSAEAVGEKEAGSESHSEKGGDSSGCRVLCRVERYRPCTWGGIRSLLR